MRILDRVTAILETIANSPQPLPAAEVARSLELPLPTVSRLMRELARRGYLQIEDRSNTYSLGPKPLAWGYAARPTKLMAELAPEMEWLRDVTGETVSLHIRSDDLRVCIAEVQSHHSVRRVVPIGLIVPLHFGATGLVLLAYSSREFIAAYVDRLDLSAAAKGALLKELEQIAKRGWAIAIDSWVGGLSGLAAPVREGNRVVASLVASGPSHRFTRKAMREQTENMLTAATRASARLSGQPLS